MTDRKRSMEYPFQRTSIPLTRGRNGHHRPYEAALNLSTVLVNREVAGRLRKGGHPLNGGYSEFAIRRGRKSGEGSKDEIVST